MTNCSLKYLSSWILLTSYGLSRNSKWYSYGTKMAGDAAQMASMEDSSSIVLDNEWHKCVATTEEAQCHLLYR